jgi:mycothiol synthase
MAADRAVDITEVTSDGDLRTWVDVCNLASPCRPEGPLTLRHLWEQAPDWTAVIAWRDGAPAGCAHVEVEHWSPGSRHAEATVVVPRDLRRRGVGGALYREVSRWAADRGLVGLDVWFDEADPDPTAFWGHRGFAKVGCEIRSLLDLATASIPAAAAPDGVTLATLAGRDDLEQGMYRVGSDGIADIPSVDPYDAGGFAAWRNAELEKPGLTRECSVVALAGGDVAGFALLVRDEARPDVAEHEMTAVAREWRGRGLAAAMKARQIELARDAGLAALEAMNEERNAAILALNGRLGYRRVTAHVQVRGPLSG